MYLTVGDWGKIEAYTPSDMSFESFSFFFFVEKRDYCLFFGLPQNHLKLTHSMTFLFLNGNPSLRRTLSGKNS